MNNVNVEGEKPEQLERAYVDELMHDEIQIKSTTPEVTSFGKHNELNPDRIPLGEKPL